MYLFYNTCQTHTFYLTGSLLIIMHILDGHLCTKIFTMKYYKSFPCYECSKLTVQIPLFCLRADSDIFTQQLIPSQIVSPKSVKLFEKQLKVKRVKFSWPLKSHFIDSIWKYIKDVGCEVTTII